MSQTWAQEKRYLGGQFVWLNTLTDYAVGAVSSFIDKSKNDTGLSEVIVTQTKCSQVSLITPQVTLSWVTRLTSLSSLKINKYFYTQKREKKISKKKRGTQQKFRSWALAGLSVWAAAVLWH